jgi:hypothetical protein
MIKKEMGSACFIWNKEELTNYPLTLKGRHVSVSCLGVTWIGLTEVESKELFFFLEKIYNKEADMPVKKAVTKKVVKTVKKPVAKKTSKKK